MKDDLKKKFYDILFEPEEREVVANAPLENVRQNRRSEHPIKASDVLYKQPNQEKPKSAFIDYEEKNISVFGNTPVTETVNVKEEKEEEEAYVRQPTISPIFGVVKQKEEVVKDVEVDDTLLKKPSDSHLGTVISPIYGYGTAEDFNDPLNFGFNQKDSLADTVKEAETKKLLAEDDLKDLDNHSLDDILGTPDDETYLSDREINLFDELFKEDR